MKNITKQKSKKFALSVLDFLKGLLIAALTSGAMILQQGLDAGNLDTVNWKTVLMAAVGGGLSYIIKNFFTDFTKTDTKE